MKKVNIRSRAGEYRVPGIKGEADAYYTNDRRDAVATAVIMYAGHGDGAIAVNGRVVWSGSFPGFVSTVLA